ncbi:MAG: smalltalk protein [Prevotella sp.]|nr:smalltalk protein [Prevotella sp.]MCI6619314.1 smalltalk protein [Prevotella sp.]MDY4038029.1 smalltalk protein [Prevotella sp.]
MMEKMKTLRFIVRLVIALASAILGVIGSNDDPDRQ